MATPINMPKLGLSMKTGKIVKWLKNEGETVKKKEILLEIATEKITNKVESKVEGTILKITAPVNSELPVGALLCVIGEPGEDIAQILIDAAAQQSESKTTLDKGVPAAARKAGSPENLYKIKISPAARRMAEENNIDITMIAGTGPEGRITREDVEKAIEEGTGLAAGDDRLALKTIPYEGMRRAIGENMSRSWTSNARVTHHVKVDMSGMLDLRRKINEGLSDKEKISVTALLTKAIARAIEINPCLNTSLVGDEIRVWQDVNIGMAVAIDEGLIVPVVRNANSKRLSEVNTEIADMAKRARKNKLGVDELSGATFTITNLGGYGSVDFFTPIINPPEVAILGIGRTIEQPVAIGGQVVVRPMMGLSLVFDHRVVDGAPAAEWLGQLITLIESPSRIFV